MDQRVAKVNFLCARHGLQHGSPDQRGHEICDLEARLLVLDEFPKSLLGDFFADTIGDLVFRCKSEIESAWLFPR